MRKLSTKELDHITKLIQKEVSYFNGWEVSKESVESSCWKAACKIQAYLRRKLKDET